VFSNTDESVRRLPRRPAWRRSVSSSRKGARAVSPGGRHLGPGKAGGIDVPQAGTGTDGRSRVAPAARGRSPEQEVSEGSFDGAVARPTRQQRSSLPARKRDQGGSRRARSRQRAVKRAAVGGRMTARWSGVFFGARGNAASKWIWKANAGGFSHGARQTASEGDVSTGARDEDVGCRNGLRGTLVPLPRNAARPHEGSDTERRSRRRTRTGSAVILLAARVLRARRGSQDPKARPSPAASRKPV
jgi:hypothetical protein